MLLDELGFAYSIDERNSNLSLFMIMWYNL